MGPKRRSSEIDEQVITLGCLVKSPPFSYIFNKKASWKTRLFKLCRTCAGANVLRYYMYDGVNEDWKGDIDMRDIKSIEVGRDTMERIPIITRLFNNSPSNILCIKTDRRDYYLVDNNTETIAEWQKLITDAWVKAHLKVPIEKPKSPSTPLLKFLQDEEEVTRPKSYPENFPHTGATLLQEQNRQRSLTDPEKCKRNLLHGDSRNSEHEKSIEEEDVFYEMSDRHRVATHSQILCQETAQPHEERRQSAPPIPEVTPRRHMLSDDMTDPAYDSESDNVYDIPRSIQMKLSENQESENKQEETSDLESESEDVYEKMAAITIHEPTNVPTKPPRTITPPNRYFKGSQLKKAQILRMMYESRSGSDLETVKVTVPIEHLQKYLGVQEIGDRLCVSKWIGPLQIGCLFHYGDDIESINGFRPGCKDLFLQMLSNFISHEVNLVLVRNKNNPVFHQDGCSCGIP